MSCAHGWRTDRHLILSPPSAPALPPASDLGGGRRRAPEYRPRADGRSGFLHAPGARGVGARFVPCVQWPPPARGACCPGRAPGAAPGLCRGWSYLEPLQPPRFRDAYRLANAPVQSLFVLARDGGVQSHAHVLKHESEIRRKRSVHLSPEGPAIGPRGLADEPPGRFGRNFPRGGVAMARRGFAVLFDVCLFRLGGRLSFVRGEEEAHVTAVDADAVMALGVCRFHCRPPYPGFRASCGSLSPR